MAGINSTFWHVSFTHWLFQHANPSFSLPLIWSFLSKGLLCSWHHQCRIPEQNRKGCAILNAFIQLFLDRWPGRWTGFLMFALFFSVWSGSFTDTPTSHKGGPRFRLFSFFFCLFYTPRHPANAPALFSLPTSHHSLWLIGLFRKDLSTPKHRITPCCPRDLLSISVIEMQFN